MEARLNQEGRDGSRASSCPSGLGGEIFGQFFGTDNLVFLIRSDDAGCSCGLTTRGEYCLFFSFLFFLYRLSDRVPQLRTSGAKSGYTSGGGEKRRREKKED